MVASLGYSERDLSILLLNDERIRVLNRRYFQKDRFTNVISFSYMNDPFSKILGDIAVSIERVAIEAERAGIPFYQRLFEVLIHGLLHILGFDHRDKRERRRMKEEEKRLLSFVFSHRLFSKLPNFS